MDDKRVYACGMSNGGMMCYRLAPELSDRIAAVAPVAGTVAIDESKPKRPVPVIHIHGSKDGIVPFEMTKGKGPSSMKLKGVEESVQTWVKLNGCDEKPKTDTLSKDEDGMKVTRTTYGGKGGSEVVLVVVEGGRAHLAGPGAAGRVHWRVGQERVGQRPDVEVLLVLQRRMS